jgi:hypothetical protein
MSFLDVSIIYLQLEILFMDQLDDSILGLFHMFSTIRALVKCDNISMVMYKLNKLKKWWVGWFVCGGAGWGGGILGFVHCFEC